MEALQLSGAAWLTPLASTGRGGEAVKVSQEQGLEGVLAKRLSSTYLPGRRSPDWVKIKNLRAQEVVIGGWKPGAGSGLATKLRDEVGPELLRLLDRNARYGFIAKIKMQSVHPTEWHIPNGLAWAELNIWLDEWPGRTTGDHRRGRGGTGPPGRGDLMR